MRPDYWKDCTVACEATQVCTVCGQRKAPVGRSSPAACAYCDQDCPGYNAEPKPGHLWPGEIADMDRKDDDE